MRFEHRRAGWLVGVAALIGAAVIVGKLAGDEPGVANGRTTSPTDVGPPAGVDAVDAEPVVAEAPLVEAAAVRSAAEDAIPAVPSMPAGGRAQDVALQVEAIIGAEISEAVAIELVEAATQHRKLYESLQRLRAEGSLPEAKLAELATMDFFFAVWPDLGAMVRDGRIKVDVHPVPAHVRSTRSSGHVLYSLNLPDRRLGVSFHTPSWLVRTKFDEAAVGEGSKSELFRRIYAAAAR